MRTPRVLLASLIAVAALSPTAAEERPAREHDARRPRHRGRRLVPEPADRRPRLDLDLDPLRHEQVDVAEQRPGVDVGLVAGDLRLAQVELDRAEERAEAVL